LWVGLQKVSDFLWILLCVYCHTKYIKTLIAEGGILIA
jgi:hypothetical protein